MFVQKDYKIPILLDYYSGLLTEKQKQAIELYYNNDLSLSEIAEEFNTTRQAVHDNIKRCEARLFELEKQLKLYIKNIETEKNIGYINNIINDIASKVDSDEIKAKLKEIREILKKL